MLFANLITYHSADGGSTYRTQGTAACQDRATDRAYSGADCCISASL